MNSIRLVISGFQTGADIGGVRAARRFGLPTSGYLPLGFLTQDGPRPEYAQLYGAREHWSPDYPPRTKSNVLWCDGVIWFGNPTSPGGKLTLGFCDRIDKPYHVVQNREFSPWLADAWLRTNLRNTEGVLLVAGNREAREHPMERWVESWLCVLFKDCLGLQEVVTDSTPTAG